MVSLKHKFHSPKDDGPDSNLVKPTNWNDEHSFTTTGEGVVLGRASGAGPGVVQELSIATLFPIGALVPYAGSSAPSGWYICDGSLKSTTADQPLFLVCQYKFGGSGSQFAVPDLRGRVVAGPDGGANRLTVPQVDKIIPGGVGGQQLEKADIGGLIVDKSTLSGNIEHPGNRDTVETDGGFVDSSGSGGGSSFEFPNKLHIHKYNIHAIPVNINGQALIGAGQFTEEVSNVQPTLVVNYIIKR